MRKLYSGLMLLLFLLLAGVSGAQTVSIGTGTSSTLSTGTGAASLQSPYNSYYGYSYVQTLYLQSEINATGNISAVNYYFSGSSLASSNQVKIYMGTVTRSAFTSTTDWEPLANLTLVFDGTISGTLPGWVNIPLTTPFAYNNTGNLLVAFDENASGDNGTSGYRASDLGANRVIFYRSDGTNPNPASPPTANGRSSYVGNIQIEGLTLQGCQSPTGFGISGITTTSATANWTAPAGGSAVTQYNWELRTSGAAGSGATGLANSGNTASTSLPLSSLTASTSYSLYVRTDCGSGSTSAWSAAIPFTTLCASASVPTTIQSFDAVSLPVCWSRSLITGTTNWAPDTDNDGVPSAHTGARFMGKDYTNSDALIVSMPIDMTTAGVSGARINVWIYRGADNAASDRIRFHINTTPDLTGASQVLEIFPLKSVAPTVAANGWYNYTADIPASFNTEPVVYVIAQGTTTAGFSSYGIGFDDLRVETIPNCEKPAGIVMSNITTTTAQVDWTAPTAGSPVNYDIYYSTSNTAPTAATTPTVTGVSALTENLSTLTAATTYYLWIRTFCGGSDRSEWTDVPVVFTTLCLATNVPYTEDFETATVPGLPSCTGKENAGQGNEWETANNPGNGFTSKTLQYEYNSDYAANAWFYTRGLNLTGGVSYRITFRYGAASASYPERLKVLYGDAPNNASMVNPVVDYPNIVSATPLTSTTDFTPSTTGVYYIGFNAYSAADMFNLYVDDISIIATPTCEVPTNIVVSNITTIDAQLDWAAPSAGSPVSYDVYYNTSGTAPTASTTPSQTGLSSLTTTLTPLTPSTTYYVWVRTFCGGTDNSAWTASPVVFATACNSVAVPTANQSFDAATLPICWSTSLVTGTTAWAPDDANDGVPSAHTGARFMGKNYNNSDALVVSMPIDMTTASAAGARINVWIYRGPDNASSDRIRFHVNTTPGLSGATQLLEIFALRTVAPSVATSGWYNYTADIPASYNTEPVVYIIAQGTTTAGFSSYGLGFDDFKVENIPTCEVPTGLAVTNMTTTTAQVDWTAPATGSPVSYDLYYNTTGTAPTGATTPSVTGITGLTENITALTPSSTYYIWVRTFCGGTDHSAWTATAVTFNTLCASASVPTAAQGFDAAAMPVCWTTSLISGTTSWAPDTDNDGVPSAHAGARFMGKNYNNSDALVISQPIDMTTAGSGGARINVWIYRGEDNAATDRIRFHVNTTPDLTGAVQLLEIFPLVSEAPTVSVAGWYNYTADIPASFNTEPTVFIIAQGTTTAGFASYGIGFDDFKVETNPLPVTLTDFRGDKDGSVNRLSWSTATEMNNAGFELQRSADGKAFSRITFIASKATGGNSTTALNYSFTDERPLPGNSYYRLKQVDRDGKFKYSNIVLLGRDVKSITLGKIYPNPVNNTLNVVISSPASENISVVITDLSGKVLMQNKTRVANGDNLQQLNIASLASGTYILKLACANGCEIPAVRFVKQ